MNTPLQLLVKATLLTLVAITLGACSTAGYGVGRNIDVLGGVPPGADVMTERARGR